MRVKPMKFNVLLCPFQGVVYVHVLCMCMVFLKEALCMVRYVATQLPHDMACYLICIQ